MIDFNKKNEDKIMIPQWRNEELLKQEGNVDVFLYMMDAGLVYVSESDKPHIRHILLRGRHDYKKPLPFEPTEDDLADVDSGYQE